jgi:hypothetical protein
VAARGVGFLFDENTPERLVRSLRELGQPAYHVYDVDLKQAPDPAVLQYAGERGLRVVTADQAILRRPHERAILKEFSLGAFFLNDTITGTCKIARTLYRHWPEMKRLAATEPDPFLFLLRETTISRIRRKRLG